MNRFLKNNPVNNQSPVYRHKAIQHKNELLKIYNFEVLKENYKKLQEADVLDSEIIKKEGEYIRTLEDELQKHWILSELNNRFDIYENKVPLNHEDALRALKELPGHSNIMKLPQSLVKNAKDSLDSIQKNGVPNISEVEFTAQKLNNSLKILTEVLNYERFEEVTFEDLRKRVKIQNWTNYFYNLKGYFMNKFASPNNIIEPTADNSKSYLKMIEQYEKISKSEREALHDLDALESSVNNNDFMQIYRILKNNSKFLEYIEDAKEQMQIIEDYLLYQTLTEINYLQNARKVN